MDWLASEGGGYVTGWSRRIAGGQTRGAGGNQYRCARSRGHSEMGGFDHPGSWLRWNRFGWLVIDLLWNDGAVMLIHLVALGSMLAGIVSQ